ncbi:MAG: hypothetical protein IJ461_01750 [Clostridia bacterium]|nr:hypothetical protein [Clostridia bacterium]
MSAVSDGYGVISAIRGDGFSLRAKRNGYIIMDLEDREALDVLVDDLNSLVVFAFKVSKAIYGVVVPAG